MIDFSNRISVVIPVYNAGRFVERAVLSALEQPETAEVILVEDGSKDNSLPVCRALASKHKKLKLFVHEGNINKGAGESRNLGIRMASFPYISFLDADDFFLPGRFEAEARLFAGDSSVDGVYGALGFHFESEEAKKTFLDAGFSTIKMTRIIEPIKPENLKWVLLDVISGKGNFSIVTLTVKKSLIERSGFFGRLELAEDTVFIIQLAIKGNLHTGIIDRPIGMRGAHENNRVTKSLKNLKAREKMYQALYDWSLKNSQPKELSSFLLAHKLRRGLESSKGIARYFKFINAILVCSFFRKYEYFFNAAVEFVFKRKKTQLFIIENKERIQRRLFKSDSTQAAMNHALGAPSDNI